MIDLFDSLRVPEIALRCAEARTMGIAQIHVLPWYLVESVELSSAEERLDRTPLDDVTGDPDLPVTIPSAI